LASTAVSDRDAYVSVVAGLMGCGNARMVVIWVSELTQHDPIFQAD
jgi:hypothetical protein